MKREEIAQLIERLILDNYSGDELRVLIKDLDKIKNMRCDTCAKGLDYEINVKVSIGSYTCKTPCPWRGCGGCFQYELKVKG